MNGMWLMQIDLKKLPHHTLNSINNRNRKQSESFVNDYTLLF